MKITREHADLIEAVMRSEDAVSRHRWAIEHGHDNEPELGEKSARAYADLVALANEQNNAREE